MKKTFSLGHRITYSMIAILVSVASIYFYFYKDFYTTSSQALVSHIHEETRQSLNKQLRRRGEALGSILTENLFNPLYTFNVESTYEMIRPVIALEEVQVLNVIDKNGKLFHDGSETLWYFGEAHKNQEIIDRTITNNQIYSMKIDDTLILSFPVSEGNVVIGVLYMEMSSSVINKDLDAEFLDVEELRKQDESEFVALQLWLTAAILILGILASWIWAQKITKPLRKLIDHLNHFGAENFQIMGTKDRTDEIGELTQAFNDMGGKINKRTDAIKYMAYHDSLTNLPNRLKFTEHVENALIQKEVKSLHLFFIDLDEFKSINDTFGHAMGDKLLVTVAVRLKALTEHHISLSDYPYAEKYNLVSRIGGDEFLVCIVNAPQAQVEAMGVALLKCLQRPISLENEERVAGGSIGISSYPEFSQNATELIKQSDMAMYAAKGLGKNVYCEFNIAMKRQAEHKNEIEQELRLALENLEEFELWYQPKIDLNTNVLVGAEALVRWNHPTRGYIYPGDFIEIAESSDIILAIGESLIIQLAKTLTHWRNFYTIDSNFSVAINLSARQIYRQDLHHILHRALLRYQLPASTIQVEVTESLLLDDEAKANKVLTKIQELGIDVWLDDFGTGYSSLSYLQNLNFNGVKIDRSFMRQINSNAKNQKLVHAVISLANSLGLDTVAEGIETQQEAVMAKKLGCHIGQGYYFAKPMPARSFEAEWLQSQTTVV